jgi:hypothetical protein
VSDSDLHARLFGLERPQGPASRTLVLGRLALGIEGLGPGLAARLDRRWGGFLRAAPPGAARATLRVLDAGTSLWFEPRAAGELYRLEAFGTAGRRVVASYRFALAAEAPGVWRVGLSSEPGEPDDRVMDNVSRYMAARLALEVGGFAMHAAAVEQRGRAFVLAGPSRAGKSTAATLFRGARSLGDDFAIVLPAAGGWVAPALPYDNAESVEGRLQQGEFPVAGIWRLSQAGENRVERLPPALTEASLVACAAFPWAMPELAETLLANARRYAETALHERLYFTREADLGGLLGNPAR